MATCRSEGCENEALPERRGLYANLCSEHKQQKYDARHNGAADARAAGEEAAITFISAGPQADSILELAMELDSAYDELDAARTRYRRLLAQLEQRVAQLTLELAG